MKINEVMKISNLEEEIRDLKAQHQKEIDSWVGLYSTDELKLIKKVKKLKKDLFIKEEIIRVINEQNDDNKDEIIKLKKELKNLKERNLNFYKTKVPKTKLKVLKEKKK